jgi:hypothetical protein
VSHSRHCIIATLENYVRTKEISVTSLTVEGSTWLHSARECFILLARLTVSLFPLQLCVCLCLYMAHSKLTRMSHKIRLSFNCPLFNDVLKLKALFVASIIMEMLKHRLLNKGGTPQRRDMTRQGWTRSHCCYYTLWAIAVYVKGKVVPMLKTN